MALTNSNSITINMTHSNTAVSFSLSDLSFSLSIKGDENVWNIFSSPEEMQELLSQMAN